MPTLVWTENRWVTGTNPSRDFDFYLQSTASGAGESTAADKDSINNIVLTDENFRIVLHGPGSVSASFQNLTPTICSVDSGGNVNRVADGTAIVDIKSSAGTRRVMMGVARTAVSVFSGFAVGSLAAHIAASIDSMISGLTASEATQKRLLSDNGSISIPNIAENLSVFCHSLNLSAISMYTSQTHLSRHPVMLISPRHFIGAAHTGGVAEEGSTIVWKAPSGVYETPTVTRVTAVTNDIAVGYLSKSITSINPFKFLPADWARYLPCLSYIISGIGPGGGSRVAMPMVAKTLASAADRPWGDGFKLINIGSAPVPAGREAWTIHSAIGGDSSGPIMVPINSETVLVSHWSSSGGGPMYAAFFPAIEGAMNAIKSGSDSTLYSLAKVDLSGFPIF